jgi:DNA polymerase-3 subunit epsilon
LAGGENVFAVLDIESTGLVANRHHVIEVAAVILGRNLEETASFSSLANPGEEAILAADPGALRANNITPAMIREAPPSADVAKELEAFLDVHWGTTLHSYGRAFDSGFMLPAPWNVVRQRWGECIMLAATDAMNDVGAAERGPNSRPRWVSLAKAVEFFGVHNENAHRALPDARAAAFVYREILRKRRESEVNDEVRGIMESGL